METNATYIEEGDRQIKKSDDQSAIALISSHRSEPNLNENSGKVVEEAEEAKKHKANSNNELIERRKGRRRQKRRRWRPYNLKWSETSEIEVKRIHSKIQQHGQPLAPYNTTQFIMNDHCDREPNFDEISRRMSQIRRRKEEEDNEEVDNSEEFYSSPEDESDYLQQQFHEAYDNVHAERLNSMSKSELVQEYLQLEDRVEDLEKKLKECQTHNCNRDVSDQNNTAKMSDKLQDQNHTQNFENKICNENVRQFMCHENLKQLLEENQKLKLDNEQLKQRINANTVILQQKSFCHREVQTEVLSLCNN